MEVLNYAWEKVDINTNNIESKVKLPKVKMVNGVYEPMYKLTMTSGRSYRIDCDKYHNE